MRIPYCLLAALLLVTACNDDEPVEPTDDGTDVVADTDEIDADESDADESDADTDVASPDAGPVDVEPSDAEDASGVDCGPELTCAGGAVCVVECLCCGIDTGNPADARTDYRCVMPDPGCTGTPAECVAESEGCWAESDYSCLSPCA